MLDFSLVPFLRDNTRIAGIAGAAVFPQIVPTGAGYPAITIETISDVPVYAMSGECGLSNARMQINSWARDYATARQLDEAVRLLLSGYAGPCGCDTIQSSFVAGVRSVFFPDPENQTATVYGFQRDFLIAWQPAPPDGRLGYDALSDTQYDALSDYQYDTLIDAA